MADFICYIILKVDFQKTYSSSVSRRVTRGGEGVGVGVGWGVLPCPFSKFKKKCLDFGKKMTEVYSPKG